MTSTTMMLARALRACSASGMTWLGECTVPYLSYDHGTSVIWQHECILREVPYLLVPQIPYAG